MKKMSFAINRALNRMMTTSVLLSLSISSPVFAVYYYTSDTSNSTLSDVGLNFSSLTDKVLSDPSILKPGQFEFTYSAVIFTPTEEGDYYFGQLAAPSDTVMILYDNVYDPTSPGRGGLIGNDDTKEEIHQQIIGDANIKARCGAYTHYCPSIQMQVEAGKTYTLWVSSYGPHYNPIFGFPFEFYSTGKVVFGEYTGRSPIDLVKPYYLSSELGISVDPIFVGGTLKMDRQNAIYLQDFTLSEMASNTLDQNGQISIFEGVFSDAVDGLAGNIVIDNTGEGGMTVFNADNTYTGTTTLKNGILSVSKDRNLGRESAKLAFDGGTLFTTESFSSARHIDFASTGQLHIADNTELTLSGTLSGAGGFTKTGASTLILSGESDYSGETQLVQGTIKAGAANSFSHQSRWLTAAGTQLNLNNLDQTIASLNHAGALRLSSENHAGTTLTINGNYTGNNGTIHLHADLVNHTMDKLVIHGASTGHTNLDVHNIATAGDGTETHGYGIETVSIDSDDGLTRHHQNTGTFGLSHLVTGGIYEYNLYQADNGNWYLRSYAQNQTTYSPNGSNFLANQYAANNLFDLTFDDRHTAYAPNSTVWMRNSYSNNLVDLTYGTQDTKIKSHLVQIGADLARSDFAHSGIFAGFGGSSTQSRSYLTDHHASGNVKGYQVGAYTNWQWKNNAYLDIWAQYAWFNNRLAGQKYDSRAWTGAAEIGYPVALYTTENRTWSIKPLAQMYYTVSDSDQFTDASGTTFNDAKNNGFRSRLGARLLAKSHQNLGVNPFIEANWIYDDITNRVELNGERLDATQPKHLGEVKLGLEGRLTPALSTMLEISGRWGEESYRRYQGQIGLRYHW